MDPLWILAVGIATVLGMILILRVNAFLALISAAMLVGLLATQVPIGQKVSDVANAFGNVAGKIAIVIALAAIIGKCLMDSGAADRIVRSFMGVLGENRAHLALLGSAYTLSIPVFFDTVFYLLVPLAKATRMRTGRRYVVYIMAIAAGGAATHSLVPPTPGPLAAGESLGVDVGVVMLTGIVVAGFASVIPLMILGAIASRWMDIPLRETPDISIAQLEELTRKDTSELPSLKLSLAPIVLPVLLITTNTVLSAFSDSKEQSLFTFQRDVEIRDALDAGIVPAALEDAATPAGVEIGPNAEISIVQKSSGNGEQWQIISGDRRLIVRPSESNEEREFEVIESPYAHLGRIGSTIGNANLALLLSSVIALWTLARQKKLSLRELAVSVHPAIASAGVIILITAAGGAFGGMLQAAGVGDRIKEIATEQQFGNEMWIYLAWGVAAVFKIAQGSGTVAIVTTSSMMASMLPGAEVLGYNWVWIVMAIGCGSKFGSWMNDSGFWVVCQMSGFTETETLKTWTVLLMLMGLVGLGTTVLLARFVPLV